MKSHDSPHLLRGSFGGERQLFHVLPCPSNNARTVVTLIGLTMQSGFSNTSGGGIVVEGTLIMGEGATLLDSFLPSGRPLRDT